MKPIGRLAAILLMLLTALPLQAAVDVHLNRSTVYQGETVVLDIDTDGDLTGQPDLAPLKQDFDILGSSQRHQVIFDNGRRRETRGWSITLRPKHTGTLRIPALRVGGGQTHPLTLEVKKIPPEMARKMAQRLFVETELEPAGEAPFVQQQLRLKVRLYYDMDLLDGELTDPAPNGDVVLERLGEDRHYAAFRGGRRYRVIERDYALFPQRSGELEIPAVVFTGHAAGSQRRRPASTGGLLQRFLQQQGIPDPFANDPFFSTDPFGDDFFAITSGRPVSARSKPIKLKVRPRPANYTGRAWLPAVELQIHDSWSEHPPEFHVGEPVTRTLVIEAKGLESSKLPQLQMPAVEGMEIYADAPVNEDRVVGDWVVGRSEQSFTYMPTREGPRVIPEVRLKWWDVTASREREAVVPRWRIEVKPGVQGGTSPPQPQPRSTAPAPKAAEGRGTARPPQGGGRAWWLAGGGGLLLLLILLAAVWWRRRREAGPTVAQPKEDHGRARREFMDALRSASEAGDPRQTAHVLLELARLTWPEDPPLDLPALARRLGRGREEVLALNRALFSADGGDWDGVALWQALKRGLETAQKDARKSETGSSLPPLYPHHAGSD